MRDLSKRQKRDLRALLALAHDRALTVALQQLEKSFGEWKSGTLTAYDLNERIHEHHDGASRALYRKYITGNLVLGVALGVTEGHLSLDEVPESCRDLVAKAANTVREVFAPEDL